MGLVQIHVPPHPLIKHWLAVARNEASPQPTFRAAIGELGRLLIYECVRDWMPMVEGQVPTPMGIPADAEVVDPENPIKVQLCSQHHSFLVTVELVIRLLTTMTSCLCNQ
jgi:uracil phosphoribosyltransferase